MRQVLNLGMFDLKCRTFTVLFDLQLKSQQVVYSGSSDYNFKDSHYLVSRDELAVVVLWRVHVNLKNFGAQRYINV